MKDLLISHSYHALSPEDTCTHLHTTSESGLSDFDAQGRRVYVGINVLPSSKKTLSARNISQTVLLTACGDHSCSGHCIVFFFSHVADAIFILVVIFINTTVGFIQEYKAEQALEKLQKSVTQYVTVVRGSAKKRIVARDLVPGDIMVVKSGDRISADGRIVENEGLYTSEAALTGESQPVKKGHAPVAQSAPIADQNSMVFAGTLVEEGCARAVVTATGTRTQIGKISQLIKEQDATKTPLQKKFTHLSRILGVSVLCAITLFAIIGIMRGEPLESVFVTATALVVSAIPEGLLPAVTVVLIFGMRRLARHNVLVRKLTANEAMGSVTTICMDKTGTLTRGEMRVSHILSGENELLHHDELESVSTETEKDTLHAETIRIAALVNDAYIENADSALAQWVVRGRPTDRALLLAATQAGFSLADYETRNTKVDTIAFTSAKKYAARAYRSEDTVTLSVLGAPDVLLEKVGSVCRAKGHIPIASDDAQKLLVQLNSLTQQGLRVLACAHKKVARETYVGYKTDDEKLSDLELVGFIALKDPVREDVRDALAKTARAGIHPIVITGDHRNTAVSIMRELGFDVHDDRVIEGKDLAAIDDAALAEAVRRVALFARVLPEHKIRIVKALQKNGEVVAMVGDGINDAPALKAADVGIAVGSGSDIAKDVSDVVLLEDSFSVIATAIEQGRLIFDNIRRVTIYLVADDLSELFLFFTMMALGFPLPLLAVQILWINLIEDGFPDIALTTEKDTKGLMDHPPRDPKEPLLSRPYKKFMLTVFLVSGIAATAIFLFFWKTFSDIDLARTVTFVLIAFDSLAFAYVIRSFHRSVFRRDIFTNHFVNAAVAIALILLFAGVYAPLLQRFLHTVPLGLFAWGIIVSVTFLEILLLDRLKLLFLKVR